MPASTIDRFGGIFTPGFDPEPPLCKVRPVLPEGFALRDDGWIIRELDGLPVCRAFAVRLRLVSTRGPVALLTISTVGAHTAECWVYEGMAGDATQHGYLARCLRRYGLEVGGPPIASFLAQQVFKHAINRAGRLRRLTRRGALKLFETLEQPDIAPCAAILGACGAARRSNEEGV